MKKLLYFKVISASLFLLSSFFVNAQTPCPCASGCTTCLCMEPNKLFLADIKTHGNPVQSVAWCCDPCDTSTLVAVIGGYPANNIPGNPNIRVYELDTVNNKLDMKATNTHGLYVFAVDCCCIAGDRYIAVGGAPDLCDYNYDVRVYKYDPAVPSLDLIASFTHGNNVRAVSWLCDTGCISGSGNHYLAIGGDPAADNTDVRILDFNSTNSTLTSVADKIHGATVYSVDWCTRTNHRPLLSIGGKPSPFGCDGPNIRVYVFYCLPATVQAYELTNTRYKGASPDNDDDIVYSVRWCCGSGVLYPYLGVGGKKVDLGSENNSNTRIYFLSPISCTLIDMAKNSSAVCNSYSVDWIPSCNCTMLTAGLGCCPGSTCANNIIVYEKTNSTLQVAGDGNAKTKFDDNVRSLAWCKVGDCNYLLVGTEVNDWSPTSTTPSQNEIALYKGVFCQPVIPPPSGICP